MALRTQAIALNAVTATPLIVKGTTTGTFPNPSGTTGDPLPVVLQNNDPAISVTVGGPNVATEGGIVLLPAGIYPMSLIGDQPIVTDIPYAIAASGTPNLTVQLGRQ